ncbi:Hypothetical protein A7982_02504 [Minicystis rosea]|nr:Hypothetical protein A7982_02504 [Minicystis rosea]
MKRYASLLGIAVMMFGVLGATGCKAPMDDGAADDGTASAAPADGPAADGDDGEGETETAAYGRHHKRDAWARRHGRERREERRERRRERREWRREHRDHDRPGEQGFPYR